MEKGTIQIQKIKEGTRRFVSDEVAVEHQLSVAFSDGTSIPVTCTPAYIEEMILAKRYLAGDLTETEKKEYFASTPSEHPLKQVSLEEIFTIAKESFENPGTLFTDTGCAHSCALIHDGKVCCCIEDIGRHNALDKVIGYALKHHIDIRDSYVFTSGRISGDYLQKVIDAGFRLVVSRAAVTHRAVELAKEKDITMLGFIRKNAGNLYHEGYVKIS